MKRVYPDKEYCIGCKLCELACMTVHSESKDLILAYTEERVKGLAPSINVIERSDICVAVSCRHCDEPACVEVCSYGALSKDLESGIVKYDYDKCVGCWSCLAACVYGAIQRNKLTDKIVKCDLCEGREDGPACVQTCPNCSLKYEDRSVYSESLKKMCDTCESVAHSGLIKLLIVAGTEEINSCDYNDANCSAKLNEISRGLKHAVVIGSGPAGLKAAEALFELGVGVAIVEASYRVLPHNSDGQAGGLLSKRIKDAGVLLKFGVNVSEVLRDKEGGVRGVLLSDKTFLEAGAVLFANGLSVDDYDQGKYFSEIVPADNFVESGQVPIKSISFCGLSMVSFGHIDPPDEDFSFDSYFYCDEVRQVYRKLVFKENRLVGYILAGDIDCAGVFTSFVKYQIGVDAESKKRLCSGMPDMLMWPDLLFDNEWNPRKR